VGEKTPPVDPGFVEFVAARSAALFRTAVLIMGDRYAAEDLVQSALERAYKNWDRVAAADAPEAYVRRIMANVANDRKSRRNNPVEHVLLDHDRHDRAADADIDGFRNIEARDAVVTALRQLPVGMRTVLVLRYFDDMTEAQISAALGISAGTVKSQAARGLAKLRAAMAEADTGSGADTVIKFPQGGAAA
jgi:RNA polymerase sigma-70 factor (sigma-E family)